MIAIIDYGVGNLYSLHSSLAYLKTDSVVTRSAEVLRQADKIILPGVGAFGDAMARLTDTGLVPVIKELAAEGKPILGICLGMQMLFEKSFEYGEHDGLGLIGGRICPLRDDIDPEAKVPHMGWNSLDFKADSPLLKYIREGDFVYYVHSYYAKNCGAATAASSEYGVSVPGLVQCGNVFGTQFHPEKSGDVGLRILKAFAEL